jgi:hypothetical protein
MSAIEDNNVDNPIVTQQREVGFIRAAPERECRA